MYYYAECNGCSCAWGKIYKLDNALHMLKRLKQIECTSHGNKIHIYRVPSFEDIGKVTPQKVDIDGKPIFSKEIEVKLKMEEKKYCKYNHVMIKSASGEIISVKADNPVGKHMSGLFDEQKDAEATEYENTVKKLKKTIQFSLREWPICKFGGEVKIYPLKKNNQYIAQWLCTCKNFDWDEMPF